MTHTEEAPQVADRVSSGVSGLDEILHGGLTPDRIYLLEGNPGTGKTTLALGFMLQGAKLGEKCLYITLSETAEELRAIARSHGWSLDQIEIFELTPPEGKLDSDQSYTLLHPSEVELSETTRLILHRIEELNPQRVAFDSLSEIRLIAQDPLRYRRQVLALKQFFSGRRCTALLLDDLTSQSHELQVHSITHGVIVLERVTREYGADRRRLQITKMRGSDFRGGYHDYMIQKGGLSVFPRLTLFDSDDTGVGQPVSSGVPEMDKLLGDGVNRGTSMLLVGPAGVGKSSLSTQYVVAALKRGESAAIYTFDEGRGTLLQRSEGLGMPLRPFLENGQLTLEQVNAAELSPGNFAHRVREQVENNFRGVVVIDSLNSYLNAMPAEQFLVMQMHELLAFLNQRGILSILIMAQHGLLGHMQSPVDISYLTDTVVLLRYFEFQGAVHKAISVIKKRSGKHEGMIREFHLGPQGVSLGPALSDFHGVLTGVPTYTGASDQLLSKDGHGRTK
ncbi:MAG TPA: ATPase domain-containing protein [Bryobacteraceae bacterium]|nr:ATPase domain-containing protein [Bryobacteraceae bacterium]